MRIIIAGAGEVGGHAADVLSSEGHSVTVIDLSMDRLRRVGDLLDVRTLLGHVGHIDILHAAGGEQCDLLIAATDEDEINILCAALAKQMGCRQTIVRVHHTANFSLAGTPHAECLGIDDLLCPEHLTAMEIARAIRNPGSIALEEFSRGQLLMQRLPVSPGAIAAGKKLSEITLPASTRVVTVESSKGPDIAHASSLISEGDFVTLIGETQSFNAARKMFGKAKAGKQSVAIMGGAATSVWLARVLRSKYFSVRLFVENHERAEELAAKLEHVTVLEADPTDSSTFSDEQIDRADVFIAATDDDEHNILGCAQAKAMGTRTVITVVQRVKYMHLFEHVGIDFSFSPRKVAVNTILSMIEEGPIRTVARFADETTDAYEIHPSKKAPIIGKELKSIKMPPKTMIAAIRHESQVHVPGAEDQVQPGDTLLVIGPIDTKDDLQRLFLTK